MTRHLGRQHLAPRHGSLPLPVLIGLVVLVIIVAVVLFNTFFYGKSVSILEQRTVLADIEDFPEFIRDCGSDDTSSFEIVTMRDEPNGNGLFLRAQLLLKYVYEKKGTQTGQILLRGDDFALVSDGKTWPAVLLGAGSPSQSSGGTEQLIMRSLALKRGPDGSIEQSIAGSDRGEDKPTLGDVVRGVKQLQSAASIGFGTRTPGVLDWVRAPLEERSKIIQPPSLTRNVWRAEVTQNKQDAWRAVEAVCLFPLPPPGTNVRFVAFGDSLTAFSIMVP